jgi:hypothetical protein
MLSRKRIWLELIGAVMFPIFGILLQRFKAIELPLDIVTLMEYKGLGLIFFLLHLTSQFNTIDVTFV